MYQFGQRGAGGAAKLADEIAEPRPVLQEGDPVVALGAGERNAAHPEMCDAGAYSAPVVVRDGGPHFVQV
ncbi:hypothetical protein A9W94_00935 [Mycobacterium asiaticum]|nr:hypothetical protein A9W94_00935 [Mycobacterium asiaticum]